MKDEPPTLPIRILHLTDHLRVGGLQTVLVHLANTSASRGFHVSVAAHSDGRLWGDLSPLCARVNAPRKPAGIVAKLAYVVWLRKLVRREKFHIIHAHQRGASFLARVATLGLRARIVEHVHNTFLPVSAPLSSFRAHHLIACGSSIERMLIKDYGRSASRVTCVNNGVNDMAVGRAIPEPRDPSSGIRLVAVGRLTEQKDPLKFVRLVSELYQLQPGRSLSAKWVGDGELLESAQKLAKDLNVNNLEFVGDQLDVAPWISWGDVLVLTSKWEGLPLAILEAMSLGRGIIAPRVGNCSEAVKAGSNGMLYDPDSSIASVAEQVDSRLTPSVLDAWGRESRKHYEEKFTPTRMIEEIERVYDITLKLSTPSSRN